MTIGKIFTHAVDRPVAVAEFRELHAWHGVSFIRGPSGIDVRIVFGNQP